MCCAFLPQPIPILSVETKTHRDITIEGVYKAVAHFLRNESLVGNVHLDDLATINDYFGSGNIMFLQNV